MYVIYEDDYAQMAFPSSESDGRIEVIWDHPKFENQWSARWAPWPLDTEWHDHYLFKERDVFGAWGPYPILLLHFRLFEVRRFLNPASIIASSPDDLQQFKRQIAQSTVHAESNVLKEFPSCFISHSTVDNEFVYTLLRDLKSVGIRCWYAPDDLKIGDEILSSLRQAISLNDKVILVLSRASIASGWVKDEIAKVFAEEHTTGAFKLFPIMIDDTAMSTDIAWVAKIRENRNIGDFRSWKDPDSYSKQLQRVLRDLTTEHKHE